MSRMILRGTSALTGDHPMNTVERAQALARLYDIDLAQSYLLGEIESFAFYPCDRDEEREMRARYRALTIERDTLRAALR